MIVRARIDKAIEVESILPDEIESYPWAGHLGLKLIHKVWPSLEQPKTTLIFINTRGMSETWYQSLLSACPDLAGVIALHQGSIDMDLRNWVEEALHDGKLKAVVCTASLDLGVDFRPVETVIQVGSPKGVARFLQRAGRSGHQTGQVSKIYFLPTHSLDLVEAAALKAAMKLNFIESREPMSLCFDDLIQYLSTLAISDGFYPEKIFSRRSDRPGVITGSRKKNGGRSCISLHRVARPSINTMNSRRWRSRKKAFTGSPAAASPCGIVCISAPSSATPC